ncbi:hypothetical protein C8R43DRAFT_963445 [Mycena crocata]|nr:hypothetical protein C8R43DRAFT_963445 [Mycena crocata]
MPTPASQSLNLTPTEIAALIAPQNHPGKLSADELDRLTSHLSAEELEEVVERLGLSALARQLPPILNKLLLAVQHVARDRLSQDDDGIDTLTRNLAVVDLDTTTTPLPSSPEPEATPARERTVRSAPSTPRRKTASVHVDIADVPASSYMASTPGKTIVTFSWFEAGALTQGVPGAGVQGSSPQKPRKAHAKAHVVFFGGEIDVFENWVDAQHSITGNGLAIHCCSRLCTRTGLDWRLRIIDTISPLPLPSSYEDNPLNSDSSSPLWYGVCRGVVPGVYRSYLECALNTLGVKGNLCNSFTTREEAERAYSQALLAGWVRSIPVEDFWHDGIGWPGRVMLSFGFPYFKKKWSPNFSASQKFQNLTNSVVTGVTSSVEDVLLPTDYFLAGSDYAVGYIRPVACFI